MGINEPNRPGRKLRRVGAVFVGLLVIVVFSIATDMVLRATGIYPSPRQPMSAPMYVVSTLYRILYGIVGCHVAARLAPDRPMGHALALGVMGLLLSIVGAVATWGRGPEFGPRWYPLALIAIAMPCAWVGGRLRLMQLAARDSR